MTLRGALRGAAWTVGLLGVLLAIVVSRATMTARAEIRTAEAALARGDVILAIDAFERAGRMRVPGARTYRDALDRLEAIGAPAAAAGDLRTARAAYEAARRAILGTRSLGTPQAERLQRVNARLADLMARADESGGTRPTFTVVLLLGFGLWVGGGAALALGGIGPDDRLRRGQALLAAAAVVGGLVLWLVGLWRA
jgi:hypothetical protein